MPSTDPFPGFTRLLAARVGDRHDRRHRLFAELAPVGRQQTSRGRGMLNRPLRDRGLGQEMPDRRVGG
jgi:hypothetical protein